MLSTPTLLLTTKFYRPSAHANWVARPELLARLQRNLSLKLTLISAPPGFGKTTLVSQWLADCGRPSAWLSLDEGDNDLAQFLRYLIAAIRTCVPEACPTAQSLLAAELPNTEYLANVMVSELTALPTALVLVLDDYHCIRSSGVNSTMRHLLRYLPPTLHLVILTRTDPPLHLGRLRITGQIAELRARDLRFAPEETRRFLAQRVDQPLGDEELQALHLRTEGWVTGLQLAVLALQGTHSLQNQASYQFFTHLRGSDRLLAGYLMEEVMAHVPETVRTFLLRTALVDRFCAPLAEALLGDSPLPGSSQALITQLEAQNLFIIPLDNAGEWYRYHDLFRDFLRHELRSVETPASLARLHQAASVWLAEAGFIEEALGYALAAGNEAAAAELVETQLHPLLNRELPMPVLRRWLALFNERAIHAHLGPLMAQAYLISLRWDFAALPPLFNQLETLLQAASTLSPNRRQSLEATLDCLRGKMDAWQGDFPRAIAYLERALITLPPAHEYTRIEAISFLAGAYVNNGQRSSALALLPTTLSETELRQYPIRIFLLNPTAVMQLSAGELTAVAHTAEYILALLDAPHQRDLWQGSTIRDEERGWAHYFLGVVHYERNELATAAQHWRQVEALRHRTNIRVYHDSLVGLARLAQAQGLVQEAFAYAAAAREFAQEVHSLAAQMVSDALEVRLALTGGQPADALRRSQTIQTTINYGASFWLEMPPLIRARALLADATPASLAAALAIVESCLRHAEPPHNTPQLIQIRALQTLVLAALRRQKEAFAALAQALTLGESGGFIRTFLDLGAPLAELLRTFTPPRRQVAYHKSLLAAFAQEANLTQPSALTAQYVKLHGITPLTPRELELLTLLSQPLAQEEVAAVLFLSQHTVKNHTRNIYTKLGVRNRRQAVAKAQALGLLPFK